MMIIIAYNRRSLLGTVYRKLHKTLQQVHVYRPLTPSSEPDLFFFIILSVTLTQQILTQVDFVCVVLYCKITN